MLPRCSTLTLSGPSLTSDPPLPRIGGQGQVAPFDGIPLNVLANNSAYRLRIVGVDQFEPVVRLDRVYNYK